jgi:capsular polysaccharide biosynthesis protein
MTLDEIFRRIVRGHMWVILACIMLPLLAVAALEVQATRPWVASVRVQVSTQNPASTTEADALSSRVLALATTPQIVRRALHDAKLPLRTADIVARKQVTAQRLGESPIVELSVSMAQREAARQLVTKLADRVVAFMNHASYANIDQALQRTSERLAEMTQARDELARKLATVNKPNSRQSLQRQLTDLQATIDQLAATKASMELAGLDRDDVEVIDPDRPTVQLAPSTVVPRLALALILGLLVGIAVAVTLETLNPRVAGTRALARLLSAPVLGSTDQRLHAIANAMTLGARRHGVETVVLVGVDDHDDQVAREMLETLQPTAKASTKPRARAEARRRQQAGQAPSTERENVAEGGPSLPTKVSFSDLIGVTPAQEPTAGVVVVTSGSPRHRDVDVVQDILKAMRWPVIGIVEARKHSARSV